MSFETILDGTSVGALVFFALSVCALLTAAITLLPQLNRTLNAYEKLADTLDAELAPTLKEAQRLLLAVGGLQKSAKEQAVQVSAKVEDVTGLLNKAATTAKNRTDLVGTGLWAGVNSYFGHSNAK